MTTDYPSDLKKSDSLADIFEIVKRSVQETMGAHRAGLMLGLADLGGGYGGLVGAFFPVGTNIIVMNKTPLRRIKETQADLYKPYAYHILLHEYLHTVGILDEPTTRRTAYFISRKLFGEDHLVTDFASDWTKYMQNLVYPHHGWQPSQPFRLELVDDFDRGNVNYIG